MYLLRYLVNLRDVFDEGVVREGDEILHCHRKYTGLHILLKIASLEVAEKSIARFETYTSTYRHAKCIDTVNKKSINM